MAPSRIDELQNKVAEHVGGPIRCPICGKEAWASLGDTVLNVLASSHDAFLRANDEKDDSPVEEGDHWSVFAIGAFCENCGFLRLHAVSKEGLFV